MGRIRASCISSPTSDLSEDEILADPVEKIAAVGGARHPSIPLPIDLFGDRKNSSGIDLSDRDVLADVASKYAAPRRSRGPVSSGSPLDPAFAEERDIARR